MSAENGIEPDRLEHYRKTGQVSLRSLAAPGELHWLREVYDRLFAERAGRAAGDHFDLARADDDEQPALLPQIMHPARYAPELRESQLLANAQSSAAQLLGAEASCDFLHAILKPARASSETPWHQDAAYWPPHLVYESVSFWVPLEDVDERRGCLHYVPGSQDLDVLQHQPIGANPRIHGLEIHPSERHHVRDAVACPLRAGDASVHGGYVLHYAGPNLSAEPRRALVLMASRSPRLRAEPRRFPWLEARQTARAERAERNSTSRGLNTEG